MTSQYACGMVPSSGNSALRLWSRANLMTKEGRLDERVILGAYSESKNVSRGEPLRL
jgi:hypothetical protein